MDQINPKPAIKDTDWLLETGPRCHGFTIAIFPSKEAAESVYWDCVPLLGADWAHVVSAQEVLEAREKTA